MAVRDHAVAAGAAHDGVAEAVARKEDVAEPRAVDASAPPLVDDRAVIGEAALVAAVRADEAELAAADSRHAREEELLAVRRGGRYGVVAAEPARAVVRHGHDATADDVDDVNHGVPAAVRLRRVGQPATVAEPRRSRSGRVDEPVVAS